VTTQKKTLSGATSISTLAAEGALLVDLDATSLTAAGPTLR
jgi:hypothetical protein